MALVDIIGRIESDAGAEARAVLEGAREHAEALVARAESEAAAAAAETIAAAEREARAEGATLQANARLASRDEALTAKHALVGRVLTEAEARLAALPDDAYTALIADGVARQARGGDAVRIASADRGRLDGLAGAVKQAADRDLGLVFEDEPASLERGVTLAADRVSSEVSPRSLLHARRDHLIAEVAGILFGEHGEA
jgi:vacuolar-type H+-ATPase subunit E/Vma4